jgi:membrane protein implicated in regulation of membrane protease activity
MDLLIKGFLLLLATSLGLGIYFNFFSQNTFIRIPGDIYINKPSLKLYIPFTSAIVVSIVLSLLFNFFRN